MLAGKKSVELLFLGTSSGMPTRSRNVTGLALKQDNGPGWSLIDCGEGTQHQLLRTSLSTHHLQAIFITHIHGDHCYGLPGLLASTGMQGRSEPLTVVAPAGIEAWLQATLQHTALHLPFELNFVDCASLRHAPMHGMYVDAIRLSHRVPSWAYRFTEAHPALILDMDKLSALGLRPGPYWGQLQQGKDVMHAGMLVKSSEVTRAGPARCVVIGGDNEQPALLEDACRDAQVLVHEATYTRDVAERVGTGRGHSSAADIACFAQAAVLPHLILTHFSARYQADITRSPSIEDIRAEAAALYHGQLFLAEDFAHYRLDKSGTLQTVVSPAPRAT